MRPQGRVPAPPATCVGQEVVGARQQVPGADAGPRCLAQWEAPGSGFPNVLFSASGIASMNPPLVGARTLDTGEDKDFRSQPLFFSLSPAKYNFTQ